MKITVILLTSILLNGCSIITVADTAVDIVLLPVKVGVAVVETAIPDGDD
jgi:hypothetical protein